MMYHLYVLGNRITAEPMSLELIIKTWGSVKKIERSGIKLVRVA